MSTDIGKNYKKVRQWEESADKGDIEKKYSSLYFSREDNINAAIAKGYVKVKPEITVGAGQNVSQIVLMGIPIKKEAVKSIKAKSAKKAVKKPRRKK